MTQTENLLNNQTQTVICPDCGAAFSVREKYCPYCGHINEIGDELSYQQKLEDIRDNLEDLEDVPSALYKEEAVKDAKSVGKIAIIIGAVLLVLFVSIFTFVKTLAKNTMGNVGKELQQQREFYASLDEMYEKGDFDSIRDVYRSNEYGIDSPINIYNWQHNQFMIVYLFYGDLKHDYDLVLDLYDSKDANEDLFREDAAYVFYNAAKLILTDWDKEDLNHTLTQDDYARIDEYKEYAASLLDKHFQISLSELMQLRDELIIDGEDSPNFDKCIEYGRGLTWYK